VPAPLLGVVARRVLPIALERMADDPVVLLEGPRSVGKSTLLREVAANCGATLLDLDDPATRDAVAADPATFVEGPATVCIDEYQKAPVVLDAVRAELNRASRPGRFVLTGSTRHDSLPAAAQSLTGRLSRLTVYPLSQGEIAGTREQLLEGLFDDPAATVSAVPMSVTTREDYISRIAAGGFPMALARSTLTARNRWFDDYVSLTLARDVRELNRVRQGMALAQLLESLAGQTSKVLNIDRAARDVSLDSTTTESYLRLLEAVFLVYRLPAWGKTLNSRSAATPKLHVLDSGVAARLLRLTPEKLGRRDPTALSELGHLLETFVVAELIKQALMVHAGAFEPLCGVLESQNQGARDPRLRALRSSLSTASRPDCDPQALDLAHPAARRSDAAVPRPGLPAVVPVVLEVVELPDHEDREDDPDAHAVDDGRQSKVSKSPSRTMALVSRKSLGMFLSSHSSWSRIRFDSVSTASSDSFAFTCTPPTEASAAPTYDHLEGSSLLLCCAGCESSVGARSRASDDFVLA